MATSKYDQQFDFTPFLRQEISTANRGGAIADIFKAVADTNDGYGNNADAKLLGNLADETNKKNILKDAFYNSENAITAGKIVDGNIDRANQLEQVARADKEYQYNQNTREAKNDALKMTKEDFFDFYDGENYDSGVISQLFNNKEDRVYTLDQREKKAIADALALKQAKAAEARRIAKYNYDMRVRKQNEIKNKQINNITSKYKDFNSFKNSEDWTNTPYAVKNEVAKSKVWGDSGKTASLNDQVKLEKINNNKAALVDIKAEYEKAYKKPMPLNVQSKFVYDGEVPELLKEKAPIDKETLPVKESKEIDGLLKYQDTLKKLEENYNTKGTIYDKQGTAFVGGVDSSLDSISPNFILSDAHRQFNTYMNDVTLGKTSALAGTLSDKDMALLQGSGLSATLGEKDFEKALSEAKELTQKLINQRYDLLSNSYEMPKHYDYIKTNTPGSDKKDNTPKITSLRKKTNENPPEIIKELKNPKTGEVKKWSNIRGFINE